MNRRSSSISSTSRTICLSDDPHGLLGVHPGGVIAPIPGRRVGMIQWQRWAHHLIADDPRASSARVDLRLRRQLGLRPARHAAHRRHRRAAEEHRLQHARLPLAQHAARAAPVAVAAPRRRLGSRLRSPRRARPRLRRRMGRRARRPRMGHAPPPLPRRPRHRLDRLELVRLAPPRRRRPRAAIIRRRRSASWCATRCA